MGIEAIILKKAKRLLGDESLSVSHLHDGNSLSKNFFLRSGYGKCYIAKLESKKHTLSRFELKKEIYSYGAAIAKPIVEFDLDHEESFCTISEWVDGYTLDKCIVSGQYSVFSLAKSACIAISSMHNCYSEMVLKQHLSQEISSYIYSIKKYGIIFPHMDDYLKVIKKIYLPSNELRGCVHMDFHTKNVVINTTGRALLIDCENMMITEPWRDFVYAVVFHDEYENLFWFSVLLKYFNYSIPAEFWKNMKFYAVIQLFRMIICEYQKENYCAIKRISESLFHTYNDWEDCVPRWIEKYLLRAGQIADRLSKED